MTRQPFFPVPFTSIIITIVSLFAACNKPGKEEPQPNLPPSSFEITLKSVQQKTASFSWTEATDPEGKEVTYSIIVGKDTIKKYTARTAELNNLTENTKYDVVVVASDPLGASTKATLTFSTSAYTTPSSFDITVSKLGSSSASINWTASGSPDNTAIKYDVYLNDTLIKQNLTDTSFNFTKLKEQTAYNVKVVAKSIYNTTQQSVKTFTTIQDPAPVGLTLQVKQVSYSLLKFSFGAATDAEGQTIKYTVLLNNTDITSRVGGVLTQAKDFTVYSLLPENNYTLTVKATDEGGKSVTAESQVLTLKQPQTPILNRSITPTTNGFLYNLETGVGYAPSKITLNINGNSTTAQPVSANVINGNTISYVYTNSSLPLDGNINITANLIWGDETERSATSGFNSYTWYNFKPSSSQIESAYINASLSLKTYTIFFKNYTISFDEDYSIVEVVFGTQRVQSSVFRTGNTTGYVTGFTDAQFAAIDAGPRTGYVVMKDKDGYHKLDFTFSYN